MTLKRLRAFLDTERFDVVAISGVPEASVLLDEDKFDVIVIDGLLEEAASACRYLYNLACAPIALLFRSTEDNWQKLYSLDVDAYLPQESTRNELVGRLLALTRRRSNLHHTDGVDVHTPALWESDTGEESGSVRCT
jgi:DNA-binding response OmpR family regulator